MQMRIHGKAGLGHSVRTPSGRIAAPIGHVACGNQRLHAQTCVARVSELEVVTSQTLPSLNGTGQPAPPDSLDLPYQEPTGLEKFSMNFKTAFALPWRRFSSGSILTIKIEGDISDQSRGKWFDGGLSVPQLCTALQKAALDPRVAGLAIEVGPLAVGYAKLQEIRRYLAYFRASGKFTVAYIKQAGEKEYYLATACEEVFAPPTASISLRGFVVGGTFLRGVLEKVGVEPQVQRIGAYKSAGDQLLRRTMAAEQREQLQCILDDTYENFVTSVAASRGKTEKQVRELLDGGIFDTQELLAGGWLNGLKYEDELMEDLKARTNVPEDKPLKKVSLKKMLSVRASTYPGLGGGRKRIVVLRTSGAILGKSTGSGNITPDALIPRLRALAKDKGVAGVVLRVDSPGGDALASDLMWREVVRLNEKKPVIASMADVAASGGYYIAMGARKIVCEPLTITGSIGVVTGKFNLAELYDKIGYAKELLSRGRYAELSADQRPFSVEEKDLFTRAAQHAYESFRDKAAASRGMEIATMQRFAQGRVWTGKQALSIGLIDALGGVDKAIQMVKEAADIPVGDCVTITEMGRVSPSPLALLRGGASAAMMAASQSSTQSVSMPALFGLLLAPLLSGGSSSSMGSGNMDASAQLSSALASTLGSGLALSLGREAAQAAVAACAVGGMGSPFGLSYSADPESLTVQAAGSLAALASSGAGRGECSGLFSDE